MSRATGISVLLVVAIMAFCYWASVTLAPKPPLQVVQITQAQLVTLPKPTPPPPPPPPKVIPPPKPLPVLIPKPIPVPSKIVVATKPPPPRHIFKAVPRPVAPHPPAPPVPVQPPAPPQAPVQRTDGEPIYGSQMHAILQANQDVPPALAQLGISGTAIVQITVAPDGRVLSAKIVTSSGNGLIDQTALAHALQAKFPSFNADMPNATLPFDIPIEIEPSDD